MALRRHKSQTMMGYMCRRHATISCEYVRRQPSGFPVIFTSCLVPHRAHTHTETHTVSDFFDPLPLARPWPHFPPRLCAILPESQSQLCLDLNSFYLWPLSDKKEASSLLRIFERETKIHSIRSMNEGKDAKLQNRGWTRRASCVNLASSLGVTFLFFSPLVSLSLCLIVFGRVTPYSFASLFDERHPIRNTWQ